MLVFLYEQALLDFGHPWVSHYKKRQNRIKFICME